MTARDDREQLAARLVEAAWAAMKDSPHSSWEYRELPPKAKGRVNRTAAAVIRALANEETRAMRVVHEAMQATNDRGRRDEFMQARTLFYDEAERLRGLADYIEKGAGER